MARQGTVGYAQRRSDQGSEEPLPPSRRRSLIGASAVAGIVGPIVFTTAFVVQGLFRRDEYRAVAETVSALEAGPNGWVQQVNFVVFGLCLIAFAVGLHLAVRRSRAGAVGPAIMLVTGVSAVVAGVAFPLAEDPAGRTVDPTGLHFPNGILFFLSIGVGLIALSRRLARDPKWRGLATYTLATGIVATILFFGLPVLVVPDDALLHEWAGLYQRLVLAVWFPCLIILSLRLRRIARKPA